MPSIPINLTYGFDAGVLHIGTPQGEMRLQWVPEPDAQHRLPHGRWQAFSPEFRIVAPPPAEITDARGAALDAKHAAFRAFRESLPETWATAVKPFQSHQWALMRLIHDSTAGMDLVKANPQLAYALANNDIIRLTPTHAAAFQAVRYSHRKQRDILGWLGLPATEAMVRLIRKIPPSIAHPTLFRKLRAEGVSVEILKQCAHFRVINTGLIYLAGHPQLAALTTSGLLHEVAEAEDETNDAPTATMLNDIVVLSRAMERTDMLRPYTTRRRIEAAVEHLNADYGDPVERERIRAQRERAGAARERTVAEERWAREQERTKRLKTQPFPDPPIPGTPDILPLTCLADLREESEAQQNCIGKGFAYAEKIAAGRLYAYRVLAPARLTLAIQKRGENCWGISDIKGYRNAEPAPKVVSAVQQWLESHQASL